jgi:hypothetical protein
MSYRDNMCIIRENLECHRINHLANSVLPIIDRIRIAVTGKVELDQVLVLQGQPCHWVGSMFRQPRANNFDVEYCSVSCANGVFEWLEAGSAKIKR